jgi:energy-coupling factor transporter transmembrane protein EcfT
MDPLIKFLGALAIVLCAVLLPLEYAPFILAALLLVAVGQRVPMRDFALACAGLIVFIALFNVVAFGGWERALLNSVHASVLMLPFYMFAKTTAPHEMMDGMRRAGVPHDFSFVFSTSLPFSKVVRKKADAVRIAQESRGGRDVWAFTVPIFHSIFQKARGLAISIESRGGLGKES